MKKEIWKKRGRSPGAGRSLFLLAFSGLFLKTAAEAALAALFGVLLVLMFVFGPSILL